MIGHQPDNSGNDLQDHMSRVLIYHVELGKIDRTNSAVNEWHVMSVC